MSSKIASHDTVPKSIQQPDESAVVSQGEIPSSTPSLNLNSPRFATGAFESLDKKLLSFKRKTSAPPVIFSDASALSSQNRPPLFEELEDASIPGNVHLISDASLERLIESNGAVPLLRQMAKDLAERDSQITEMRKRCEDREKKLKHMLFESGVSRSDVERRLASILQRRPSRESIRSGKPRSEYSYIETLDDQLQDAMSEIDYDETPATEPADLQFETPRAKLPRGIPRSATQPVESSRSPNPTAPSSPEARRSRRASALSRWSAGLFGWDSIQKEAPSPPSPNEHKEERPPPPSLLGLTRNSSRPRGKSSASSLVDKIAIISSPLANADNQCTSHTHVLRQKEAPNVDHWPEQGAPPHFRAIIEAEASRPPDLDAPTAEGWLVYKRASSTIANLAYGLVFDRNAVNTDSQMERIEPEDPKPQAFNDDLPIRGARRMDDLHARLKSISLPRTHETWISPALRDTANAVLPNTQKHLLHRNSTMELATFIPDAEQPPSMLPAWNDNTLASRILTDRFGFKLFDARSKRREISEQLLQTESTPDSNVSKPDCSTMMNEHSERTSISNVSRTVDSLVSPLPSLSGTNSGQSQFDETLDHDSRCITASSSSRNVKSITDSAASPRPLTPETSLSKSGAVFSNERSSARLHMLSQLDLYGADKAKQERWDNFLQKTREDRRKGGPKGTDHVDMNQDELIGLAGLGTGKMAKERLKELNSLIFGGIPMNYRPKVWGELTGAYTLKEPLYYQELLSHGKDTDPICVDQIDLDIRRTMPSNVFFAGTGPGVSKLRRVLLAFSRHNTEVGYCQGMNVIAATLLLTHPTEEDAFFVLACIVEKILPLRYFTPDLLTSRADQSVLKQLFAELCPQSQSHLQSLGIDLEAITFGWFLSVFTDCLPAECLFRTWDVFFIEGHTYLFCVAITILKLHEKALLECEAPGQVYTLLKDLPRMRETNIDEFVKATEQVKMTMKTKGYDIT